MTKYDDKLKYKALNLLHQGGAFATVADKTGLPLTVVIRLNKELKKSVENGGINSLIDMDRVVLGEVLETISENKDMTEAVGKLTESINHSDRLSSELQAAAIHLVKQAKSIAMKAEDARDILVCTEVICSLQNAFFNSNSTQINIQNNNQGYTEFLSDAPAA